MKLLRNIAAGITMLTAATFAVAQTIYKIESVNSGKVIDVAGFSVDDGATVHQWGYNGTTNQQWTLVDAGNGAFLIRNVGSGKVLDIVDSSTELGAYVTQMESNGNISQQWYIDDLGDGTKIITNANSGMLLDVEGISFDDGALLHQWENWGGTNQQWRLVEITGETAQPLILPAKIPLHYAWHPLSKDWFYSTNRAEIDNNAIPVGYEYRGIACFVYATQVPGSIPLYRYRYTQQVSWGFKVMHFYTTSEAEGNSAAGYVKEGIQCYVFASSVNPSAGIFDQSLVPLKRYFDTWGGGHVYTIQPLNLSDYSTYIEEGTQCYVYERQ